MKGCVREERGVALIVALGVLSVLILLTGAVVGAAVDESGVSSRDTKEKRAFEAAQAGLQATNYRMNMLLNANNGAQPSTLESECIGGTVDASGNVTLNTEQLEAPASFYASIDCGPYTESLGNGAFYKSWTSVVLSSGGTCAGTQVGTTSLVTQRCIASQGIICPPSYTQPSQLPCPNPVIHRVEERVAAASGRPVFPYSGVLGLDGVLIQNSAHVQGNVATNLQLAIQNTAQVSAPALLSPAAANPKLTQSALLGTGLVCNSVTVVWPAACVTPESSAFSLLQNPPPYPEYTDDTRIANGLSQCALANTCPHDVFSTSSGPCTTCANWNGLTRTLTIPNGVTWTISGGTYNLCSLVMTGSATAVLANGVKTSLYIDSPSNPSPSPVSGACPAGTGNLSLASQSQFVNNSPPLPGSTLAHDSTALQIWVFGPSLVQNPVYNNNSCGLNGSSNKDSTCVQFGQGTDFYGTIYAPTSDVYIGNQGSTYGGVAARTVTFNNPGLFQQDTNVPTLVTTATLALYFRSAWSECQPQPATSSTPMSGC